jgi:hypothetical protein
LTTGASSGSSRRLVQHHKPGHAGQCQSERRTPVAKARLGSGARFKAIERAAKKSGARNPAAVAAAAGIAKYGKRRMAKMAAAGRRRK